MKIQKTTFAYSIIPAIALSTGALAQAPYLEPDESFITVSGEIESVSPDTFTLNYGEGTIIVEMDDGDRDADAYKLISGDEVTVTGRIDDDFYETTTIEASSVYVENLDTYFFASSMDEESYPVAWSLPLEDSMTSIYGQVTSVGGDDFTMDTDSGEVTIEVDEMVRNPLDDIGYLQIEQGDVLSVSGHIDIDLFEDHTFEAVSIREFHDSTDINS